MTQTELAAYLGVERSAISLWETDCRTPKTSEISKICRFFGVSVDYLCCRTESRNSVIAPPSFKMDITRLNEGGQAMLLEFFNFLVQNEKYKA